MADIELSRAEAREGNLPLVCIICGQAGSVYRRKVLYWTPWWSYVGLLLGPLGYLLVMAVFSTRRRVQAPFCELHKHHWLWRSAVGLGVLLLVLLAFLGTLYRVLERTWIAGEALTADSITFLVFAWCIVSGVLLFLWPLLTLLLKYSGVHASAVAPQRVTLTPVAAEFVEAVRVRREDRALDSMPDW